MKTFIILLLTIFSIPGVLAINSCLDPDHERYKCEVTANNGVYLRDCNLTDEDWDDISSCFMGLEDGCTSLWLSDNSLTTLPDGIFDMTSLASVDILWLQRNRISALPDRIFDELTSIKYISLDDNAISILPDGIFDKLTGLENLLLFGNDITTLPGGIFDKLTGLEILLLNGNGITALPGGIFDKLTGLQLLWLHDNKIPTIPGGFFDVLTSLEELDLGNNDIVSLPDGIFDGLTSLEDLHLNDNKLTGIESGTFSDLVSLVYLDVSPCTRDGIIASSSTTSTTGHSIVDDKVNLRGMDRLEHSYSCPTSPTSSPTASSASSPTPSTTVPSPTSSPVFVDSIEDGDDYMDSDSVESVEQDPSSHIGLIVGTTVGGSFCLLCVMGCIFLACKPCRKEWKAWKTFKRTDSPIEIEGEHVEEDGDEDDIECVIGKSSAHFPPVPSAPPVPSSPSIDSVEKGVGVLPVAIAIPMGNI